MQRTAHDRSSHVLVFGQTGDQYQEWRMMVKGGLQSMHMGWGLTLFLSETIDDAVEWIQNREDLEIVFITNRISLELDIYALWALWIAIALKEHKYKPWVLLDESTDYLKVIFEENGVEVKSGMIEMVIFDRWNSQIVREKPSEEEKTIADEEATQA